MPGIDLHTHSTASDGSLTPRELVRLAKDTGLEAVALTDHDTVAGLPEFTATGRELGMETVCGCELSVQAGHGTMHIVGLFLPERPQGIIQALDELVRLRHERNVVIVEKLRQHGCDVTYEEIKELAGEGSVGRPHISQILVRKGYANSVQDAFDRWLATGAKAYVPKKKFTPDVAIPLLKGEGATVVLAHPYMLGLGKAETEAEVRRLMEFGLDGLEAYYPEHSPSQTAFYLDLAARLDLAVSGGSDFHGTPKPRIGLGSGKGDLHIPYGVLAALKARRA